MRDFHALWWFIEFWIYLILRVLVRITDRLGGNFLAFLLLQDLAWETSVGTQLRVHLKWNNWKWFALKMLELYLKIKDLGHFRRFRGFLPWFGPTSSAHFLNWPLLSAMSQSLDSSSSFRSAGTRVPPSIFLAWGCWSVDSASRSWS